MSTIPLRFWAWTCETASSFIWWRKQSKTFRRKVGSFLQEHKVCSKRNIVSELILQNIWKARLGYLYAYKNSNLSKLVCTMEDLSKQKYYLNRTGVIAGFTVSTLIGFVHIATLCSKQWVAFTIFVPVRKNGEAKRHSQQNWRHRVV